MVPIVFPSRSQTFPRPPRGQPESTLPPASLIAQLHDSLSAVESLSGDRTFPSRELAALARERDPEALAQGIFELARREEVEGRPEVAAILYVALAEAGISRDWAGRARARLRTLNGEGNWRDRAVFLLRHAAREALDAPSLLAMVGAGATFRLARMGALQALSGTRVRGAAARWLAAGAAFSAEAIGFPIYSRLGNQALARPVDWDNSALRRDIFSSFMVLGGLRAGGALSRLGIQRFLRGPSGAPLASPWSRAGEAAFQQGGMLAGIFSGHAAEALLDLRPGQDPDLMLVDSLVTLLHFNVAGGLIRHLTPKAIRRWESRLEQETRETEAFLNRPRVNQTLQPALAGARIGWAPAEGLGSRPLLMAASPRGRETPPSGGRPRGGGASPRDPRAGIQEALNAVGLPDSVQEEILSAWEGVPPPYRGTTGEELPRVLDQFRQSGFSPTVVQEIIGGILRNSGPRRESQRVNRADTLRNLRSTLEAFRGLAWTVEEQMSLLREIRREGRLNWGFLFGSLSRLLPNMGQIGWDLMGQTRFLAQFFEVAYTHAHIDAFIEIIHFLDSVGLRGERARPFFDTLFQTRRSIQNFQPFGDQIPFADPETIPRILREQWERLGQGPWGPEDRAALFTREFRSGLYFSDPSEELNHSLRQIEGIFSDLRGLMGEGEARRILQEAPGDFGGLLSSLGYYLNIVETLQAYGDQSDYGFSVLGNFGDVMGDRASRMGNLLWAVEDLIRQGRLPASYAMEVKMGWRQVLQDGCWEVEGEEEKEKPKTQEGMIDPAFARLVLGGAEFLGAMVRRGYAGPSPEALWPYLGLHHIEFGDGGNGVGPLSAFMGGYLPERQAISAPRNGGEEPLVLRISRVQQLPEVLRERGIYLADRAERFGRSYYFPSREDPRTGVVAKITKAPPRIRVRDPQAALVEILMGRIRLGSGLRGTFGGLFREWDALTHLRQLDTPLRSHLPEPLLGENGQPILLQIGPEKLALLFRAPRDYYRYLTEPGIPDRQFLEGLGKAIHDSFLLARHGWIHTVPIRLFHNAEPGAIHRPTGDLGRFVAAPDIAFAFFTRFGMGRLNDWRGALEYGNFGLTGLRDFEEVYPISHHSLTHYSDSPARELRRLGLRKNANALTEASLLGNSLLAANLYIGERMARQNRETPGAIPLWRDRERLDHYAGWLRQIFSEAYAVRQEISREAALEIMEGRVDWLRFARQIAFFMTPDYVPYLREGAPASEFPTEEIYGTHTRVGPVTFGPYREGTFHPERGFIGPSGNPEELSLGPVNGQFPIREFERAFWAVFLPRSQGL